MPRPLPPLTSLRAFEATARHLSFTRAAEELNVTAAALSHQVRGLEAYLGKQLFTRSARAIALTPAGAMLYPGLHAAFLQLRQSVDLLERDPGERVLVVSAPPGFTAKWLTPRLYRFMMAHPDVDTRISASQGLSNFTSDGVDVAVRNARAPFRGLWTRKLLDVRLVPVASPRLIEAVQLADPTDLRRVSLIHDDMFGRLAGTPGWPEWLAAAGVDGVDLDRGLRFSSSDHAMDAAVEGAGVLLATKALVHDDLRTGRLIAPFALELASDRGFHLVCPEGTESRFKVRAFCEWVLTEAASVVQAETTSQAPLRVRSAGRAKTAAKAGK